MNSSSPLSRRAALSLGGTTVLGGSAVLLAACSSGGGKAGAGGAGAAGGGASGPQLTQGATVLKLADIPVGGTASAKVEGKPLLLAQPSAGTVVCFSAICTHQGCVVDAAAQDFECPCHGSTYATDGSVTNGPAVNPLAKVDVKVSGDSVVIA